MPIQETTQVLVRKGSFITLVVLITLAFLGLIQDFLMACFWAAILSVVFHRTFRIIRIKLKGRSNLAAFATVLFILFVVILPLFLVTLALVRESAQLYQRIQTGDINLSALVDEIQSQLPLLQSWATKIGVDFNELRDGLSSTALEVTQTVANRALLYAGNALNTTIQFFLMLYLLFFFLKDGKIILRHIIRVVPMGDKREWALLNRIASVARATLKGTIIVAIVQGSIGGLLFWSLGIDGAVLWGVLMTLLSLLPVGGSGIVWIPAAIIFLIQGQIAKALIIIAVGSLFIGLIDNLLRPLLVGRDTKMPDYLVLLATLGGITWFGLSGFIIGPVIAAIFLTCWDMMAKEYGMD